VVVGSFDGRARTWAPSVELVAPDAGGGVEGVTVLGPPAGSVVVVVVVVVVAAVAGGVVDPLWWGCAGSSGAAALPLVGFG
jgi:hypothetical protein